MPVLALDLTASYRHCCNNRFGHTNRIINDGSTKSHNHHQHHRPRRLLINVPRLYGLATILIVATAFQFSNTGYLGSTADITVPGTVTVDGVADTSTSMAGSDSTANTFISWTKAVPFTNGKTVVFTVPSLYHYRLVL